MEYAESIAKTKKVDGKRVKAEGHIARTGWNYIQVGKVADIVKHFTEVANWEDLSQWHNRMEHELHAREKWAAAKILEFIKKGGE